MISLSFIARRRWDDNFEWMNNLFKDSDKYVYFIENDITHAWLTEELKWTTDPTKAIAFKNEYKAKTYAIQKALTGWTITEHEFI